MHTRRTRIAAYGLVVRDERLLLCRISRQVPRWQGKWTLPGGGIEFAEHPEQAMIREVEEETGLQVAATSIAAVDSLHDDSRSVEVHSVRLVYHTRCIGGELRYEIDGTTDRCQWFTLEETGTLELLAIAQLGVDLAFAGSR